MSMLDWAKREVDIACKKERGNESDDKFDYGCACYASALKAFESLIGDDHSGTSIGITKGILNRLIDGKPLTPIEDEPDAWNDIWRDEDRKCTCYQSKRMSCLFKYVYDDGQVEYRDIDRFICKDEPSGTFWHNSFVAEILSQSFPITFPYAPLDKPIVVHRTTALFDCENGDYDTMAIWYAETPDGNRTEINRFFKEADGRWQEICEKEYQERLTEVKL